MSQSAQLVKVCQQCGVKSLPLIAVCPKCAEILPDPDRAADPSLHHVLALETYFSEQEAVSHLADCHEGSTSHTDYCICAVGLVCS